MYGVRRPDAALAVQQVEGVPYRIGRKKGVRPRGEGLVEETLLDVSAVDRFAQEWREQNRGKWLAVEQLGGFCLLLKRQVLDKIGPLEGQAGLSLFDTALLCARARQAGFTQACARDLFIHHFGSRTFAHGAPTAPGGVGIVENAAGS